MKGRQASVNYSFFLLLVRARKRVKLKSEYTEMSRPECPNWLGVILSSAEEGVISIGIDFNP